VLQLWDWLNDVTLPLSVSTVTDVTVRSPVPVLEIVMGLTNEVPLAMVPNSSAFVETEREALPACVTVTVFPARVSVPVREAPVLAVVV
jgi:hypothetical protein